MQASPSKWQRLIGEAEWCELRAAYHGRQTTLRLTTTQPQRFSGLWAEWEVAAIARFTHAPYNPLGFKVINGTKTIQPALYLDRAGKFREASLRQLRAAGASLSIAYFENYSNSSLALSRELEAECHCPVQVNLYITPAGRQGLGSHVDSHDVLVLQIAGQKNWTIFDGAETTAPQRDVVLETGGWLFLPKGMRHEVQNRGAETSVHLTVGFHPLRWAQVYEQALKRAQVSHPGLNEPLPHGAAPPASAEAMRERLGSLLQYIDLPEFAARYYGEFSALEVPVPDVHDVALEQRAAIRADTPLRWREEAVWTPAPATPSTIMLPYRRAPLKLEPEWNQAVETMRAKGRFAPAELPLETPSAILLCQLLSGTGMLSLGENG